LFSEKYLVVLDFFHICKFKSVKREVLTYPQRIFVIPETQLSWKNRLESGHFWGQR